jgi:hypothetical protein
MQLGLVLGHLRRFSCTIIRIYILELPGATETLAMRTVRLWRYGPGQPVDRQDCGVGVSANAWRHRNVMEATKMTSGISQ